MGKKGTSGTTYLIDFDAVLTCLFAFSPFQVSSVGHCFSPQTCIHNY